MSAALAPRPAEHSAPQLRLQTVEPGKKQRMPFMVVILSFLGIGMAGVLLLATSLQSQTNELTQLQRQAAALRYEQAALLSQVEDARSSQQLASRAWELGMRPNPHPVLIQLPDGTVLGEPKAAPENALPGMAPRPISTPTPQPSAGVDPQAAASQTVPAPPELPQASAVAAEQPTAAPDAQPAQQPATQDAAAQQAAPQEPAPPQAAPAEPGQAPAAAQEAPAPAGQGGR